jgi:hypothetical protein
MALDRFPIVAAPGSEAVASASSKSSSPAGTGGTGRGGRIFVNAAVSAVA